MEMKILYSNLYKNVMKIYKIITWLNNLLKQFHIKIKIILIYKIYIIN